MPPEDQELDAAVTRLEDAFAVVAEQSRQVLERVRALHAEDAAALPG